MVLTPHSSCLSCLVVERSCHTSHASLVMPFLPWKIFVMERSRHERSDVSMFHGYMRYSYLALSTMIGQESVTRFRRGRGSDV